MLKNKQVLEKLECKAGTDGHIIELPIIILPCGLVSCQKCYEKNRRCLKCDSEHLMVKDEKENDLILKLIKDNIKELRSYIKFKLNADHQPAHIEGNLLVFFL
jgi:hypothetical protein